MRVATRLCGCAACTISSWWLPSVHRPKTLPLLDRRRSRVQYASVKFGARAQWNGRKRCALPSSQKLLMIENDPVMECPVWDFFCGGNTNFWDQLPKNFCLTSHDRTGVRFLKGSISNSWEKWFIWKCRKLDKIDAPEGRYPFLSWT